MNFILQCFQNFSYRPSSVVSHLLHHTQHFLSLITNISENHHKIIFKSRYAKCPPSLLLRAARLTEHRRAAGQVVSQHFHRLVFHLSSSHYCPPSPPPPTARDPPSLCLSHPTARDPPSLCLSQGRLSPSLPSSHLPSHSFIDHVHKSPEFLPHK
jgi:hypothetical protein